MAKATVPKYIQRFIDTIDEQQKGKNNEKQK